MKPLVGRNLQDLKACLRQADTYLRRAEKLAYGAYGSHDLTMAIRCARDEVKLGNPSYEKHPFVAYLMRQLTPPPTPKVRRMRASRT